MKKGVLLSITGLFLLQSCMPVDPEDDDSDYLHGQDFVLQTTPLLDGEDPS